MIWYRMNNSSKRAVSDHILVELLRKVLRVRSFSLPCCKTCSRLCFTILKAASGFGTMSRKLLAGLVIKARLLSADEGEEMPKRPRSEDTLRLSSSTGVDSRTGSMALMRRDERVGLRSTEEESSAGAKRLHPKVSKHF